MAKKTLSEVFDIKTNQNKTSVLTDYEIFPNKVLLDNLRNQIIEPLLKFKENVSKNRTVKEITKYIYEFLVKNDIPKILDNKIKSINDTKYNW